MKRMTAEKAAALDVALAATQLKPVAKSEPVRDGSLVEADGTVVVTITPKRRNS
jgi:hypothetical protein